MAGAIFGIGWSKTHFHTFPHLTKLEIEEGFRLQKSDRMYFHPFVKNAPCTLNAENSQM
jgi:hypothetical protein